MESSRVFNRISTNFTDDKGLYTILVSRKVLLRHLAFWSGLRKTLQIAKKYEGVKYFIFSYKLKRQAKDEEELILKMSSWIAGRLGKRDFGSLV